MSCTKGEEKLTLFKEFAEKLGARVIYDTFPGRGGWCRANGRYYVIINRKLPPDEKIEIFVDFFRGIKTDTVYLHPLIREEIER